MPNSSKQGGYSTNEVRWSTRVSRCTFVVVFHRWAYSSVLAMSAYRKVRSSTIGIQLPYFMNFLLSVSGIITQFRKWTYSVNKIRFFLQYCNNTDLMCHDTIFIIFGQTTNKFQQLLRLLFISCRPTCLKKEIVHMVSLVATKQQKTVLHINGIMPEGCIRQKKIFQ